MPGKGKKTKKPQQGKQQKQQGNQGKKGQQSKKRDERARIKSRLLRPERRRGRQSVPDQLRDVLKPTEDDIMKLLAAQTHIGRRRAHMNMKRYIWKRRSDGFHIINLEKTWAKLQLAARIIVTVHPGDIMVLSTRTFGQRGAIKFANAIGAKSMVGKWVPGTLTNPQNKIFEEPRLIVVDDPATNYLALRETSYVGIPVIGFCGIHNNTRFVDCAIPCNNRGRLSIGLMFWLLAREVKRMKGEIPRNQEWDYSVDLFFYRDANKVLASQEKQKKEKDMGYRVPDDQDYYDDEYVQGTGAQPPMTYEDWQDAPPEDQLPGWGQEEPVQQYGAEEEYVQPDAPQYDQQIPQQPVVQQPQQYEDPNYYYQQQDYDQYDQQGHQDW